MKPVLVRVPKGLVAQAKAEAEAMGVTLAERLRMLVYHAPLHMWLTYDYLEKHKRERFAPPEGLQGVDLYFRLPDALAEVIEIGCRLFKCNQSELVSWLIQAGKQSMRKDLLTSLGVKPDPRLSRTLVLLPQAEWDLARSQAWLMEVSLGEWLRWVLEHNLGSLEHWARQPWEAPGCREMKGPLVEVYFRISGSWKRALRTACQALGYTQAQMIALFIWREKHAENPEWYLKRLRAKAEGSPFLFIGQQEGWRGRRQGQEQKQEPEQKQSKG